MNNVNQIRDWAKTLYKKAPFPVRWIISPLIFCRRSVRQLRVELCRVEGIERSSQMPLSILCGAKGQNKSFLLGLAFAGSFREQILGRVWLWNISKAIHTVGKDCSLMLIEVRKSHRKWLRACNWFFVPCWVIGEIDIPFNREVLNGDSVKSDLRRIRKNGLEYEVTRDPRRFDDFYHNMYVPHISRAHGSEAYIVPYEEKKIQFQKCDLLLVKKDDKDIAGILLRHEPAGPRLWSLGIRDGNQEYLKAGAASALFHFSIQYLAIKGFSRVKIGLSRAFLRDGVLQYKRKLSQRITEGSADGFALKVLSYTPAARAFLRNNPFLFETDGALHSAIFVDPAQTLSQKELEEIHNAHCHPGISKLVIYRLQQGDAANPDTVPPELAEHIVLRSVEDIARTSI